MAMRWGCVRIVATVVCCVAVGCTDSTPPGATSTQPLEPFLTLEEEIEFDYISAWDAYFAAMADTDLGTAGMAEAATGQALETMRQRHTEHVNRGLSTVFPDPALRTHRIEISSIDDFELTATLVDCFTENSFEQGANGVRFNEGASTGQWAVTVELEAGRWKPSRLELVSYWDGEQPTCD